MKKLFLCAVLSGCTVTFDPTTNACMISFSPDGEQIKAMGECAAALTRLGSGASSQESSALSPSISEESP